MLNYHPLDVPSVSLSRILAQDFDRTAIQDRIILIGAAHQKTKDFWLTPFSQSTPDKIPGVFLQAQMVSQIISAVLDQRPLLWTWNGWIDLVWIASWSLLSGGILWRLRSPLIQIIAIATGSGILYLLCFGVFIQGGWIPFVPSLLTLILTGSGVVIYHRSVQQQHVLSPL
jgi:CHASE2 domain-containing sensor protein